MSDGSTLAIKPANITRKCPKATSKEQGDVLCGACGQPTPRVRECVACHLEFYCSVACQQKGWAMHRLDCKRRSSWTDFVPWYTEELCVLPFETGPHKGM